MTTSEYKAAVDRVFIEHEHAIGTAVLIGERAQLPAGAQTAESIFTGAKTRSREAILKATKEYVETLKRGAESWQPVGGISNIKYIPVHKVDRLLKDLEE